MIIICNSRNSYQHNKAETSAYVYFTFKKLLSFHIFFSKETNTLSCLTGIAIQAKGCSFGTIFHFIIKDARNSKVNAALALLFLWTFHRNCGSMGLSYPSNQVMND